MRKSLGCGLLLDKTVISAQFPAGDFALAHAHNLHPRFVFNMMTEDRRPAYGKISVHGDGLGAPSPDMVEKRAREIAMIDERDPDEFTDADWEQARRELLGIPATDAPEEPGHGVDVPEEEREIVPESPAHRAPRAGFDDDESLGETLVSGGLEEAAHDQMLEARREERESEET